MAGVNLTKTNIDHAKKVAKSIKASGGNSNGSVLSGIWHWINGVASGVGHFIKTLGIFGRVVSDYIQFLDDCIHFILTSLQRALTWLERFVLRPMEQRLQREIRRVAAKERSDVSYLIRLIYVVARTVMQFALRLVRREHHDMTRAVKHAEALARHEVRRLHHRIEHEAASGYSIDNRGRTGLAVKLLEFLGAHNPEVQAVVGDIATGLIDLLSIDDPLLRISIGFLIKHVIDRLGIEKPLGHLIEDLIAPILGNPKPRDLHDVIADISARLGALEGQWATFFEDGGSEVEQAGREWQGITSLAASLGIVAFTAQAVADPVGWAAEVQAVVGRPANDLVTAAARLFRG